MPLERFPFRFRDPVSGKWVKARYRAERHVIAERHAEWEIIGDPLVIEDDQPHDGFNPYRGQQAKPEPPPQMQPHLEMPVAIDHTAALLVCYFLRRYVTWCARSRRYAQMQGAARLWASVRESLA